MATQQMKEYYRHGIWQLHITHKTNTRCNHHGWSPTIPRRVSCQSKDAQLPTQGWLPCLALLGPIWPGLTPFCLGCPCLAPFGSVWSCLALSVPFGPVWPCLALFGPVWPHLALFGLIWPCLTCFTPSGSICSCLAPFGTLSTWFNTIQSSLTTF